MYLKRIELHGFKSFADRVELEFQPGINAIVGPNGSGKSNIIDAIRWVLGEQSIKTLRGYKLEDVIFAGSNKKKPMGMAEVAITIDNSDHLIPLDYSEICFIRRTFRSGESEFFLNRTPCRLKDIQEILVDSGVGKDGYSVISQGQIDQILTCRADERRAIFEETAGIMKYQIRKKEAEKRLEETMSNIYRIDDLISELLNQLDPLAVQKDIALKYKKLTSAFKEIDVNLLLLELDSRKRGLKYIKDNLEENKTSLTQLDITIESLKKQLIDYKSKQNANEKTFEKAQSDFFDVNSQRKDIEKDFQWATVEKERIQTENKKILDSITKKQAALHTAKKSLNSKADDLEKKIKVINQLEIDIIQNENKLISLNDEISEKQQLIENVKGDVIDLLNHVSEKRNVVSGLNTMKQNLEKRLNQIQNEKLQLDEANELTLKDVTDIKGEIAQLELLCIEQGQDVEKLKKILNQKVAELENSEKIEMQQQQELTMVSSRMKALKEIADGYEGYQFGVKNLLIALKKKRYIDPGICGTVAEVISVKQQYEVAVETALGGAMQNIICENEENAKKAIDFLKRNHYGRVTFLPLSTVKPRLIDTHESTILSMRGCISAAIDLVTFDKKYYAVLAYLLGRVLVSDTLDDAIDIAKQCNFIFKIVTIQGEVLSPGGSITGGSKKRSNFLLSRKRQLIEYERKINELNMQLNQKKQFNQKLKNEIQTKQSMLEENSDSLYCVESKIAVLKKQLQEKQSILEERLYRKKQLDEEKLYIESETQEILSQISLLESDIGNIDTQNISSQSRAKHLQEQLDKNNEIKDKVSEKITELKVKLAACKQEEISIRQSLQTIEENIKFHVEERNNLKQKDKENNDKIVVIDEKVFEYKENIKKLKNTEQEYQKVVESSREQKEAIKSSINRAQEKLNKLEKEYNQTKTRLHEGNIEEATTGIELNQIKNQIYERYSLTVPQALKIKKQFTNIDDKKKDLALLKKEIESLGPINMQAIEDYDNLKARHDFLKSQRDDLMKGKINLDSLIEEMVGTMEKMLLASIRKVNDEFNKVFSELFEGGKAQLIIEGEGSILECGVEINAQPPGKKLQSLSLLSGGESALTAIALLFAILNTKATPFCVLDEIEATLDDVNIVRFTKYLKKVSKHTQFIIITHRKLTMEVADALYGISMEDTAVSKVLAVKMV